MAVMTKWLYLINAMAIRRCSTAVFTRDRSWNENCCPSKNLHRIERQLHRTIQYNIIQYNTHSMIQITWFIFSSSQGSISYQQNNRINNDSICHQ